MILAELKWTVDNGSIYTVDRYVSQFLIPASGSEGYSNGAYKIVKRVPPHVRAGYYSIRGFDRPFGTQETPVFFNYQYPKKLGGGSRDSPVKLLDELEIACFIAHLIDVPAPLPWWKRILRQIIGDAK